MLLVATGVLTTGYGKPQPARRIPRPPPLRREGSGRKRRGSSRARPAAGRAGKGKTWQVILLNRGLEDVDGNGWKMDGKWMENGSVLLSRTLKPSQLNMNRPSPEFCRCSNATVWMLWSEPSLLRGLPGAPVSFQP